MLAIKRIYAYLFLLFFSWQFIGFASFLQFSKLSIRKDMKHQIKAGIPESKLRTFSFTYQELKQLVWLEKDEFEFQGHMYDMVFRSYTKNGVVVKCIDDVQEAQLFKKLDHYVAKRFHSGEKGAKVLAWLDFLKVIHSNVTPSDWYVSSQSTSHFFSYKRTYFAPYLGNDPIPPEFNC